MFHVETELVRFCEEHGVGPWVADELNRRLLLDDWATWFVDRHVQPYVDERAGAAAEGAAALHRIIAMLDENPKQKTISIARLRAAIADT